MKPKHGAALTCMAEYAINIAKEKAAIAHSTLGTMVQTTPEIRLKQHYHACLEHYTDAMDNIEKVQKSYETKDFFGMNIAASALMTNVDDCETSEAPGYDPSVDLKRKNEELEYASIILMILANQLGGRHKTCLWKVQYFNIFGR
ncbi:pectinesterase inhibitor-like [Senna tora]|uniref:Pectinesterase inhibitor-like n=1 Tax=Senna tora TaxID=362788 RepID=A0A834X4T2_9FABA|nr:pectinesterase inhibitor-like [Senna tora]